MKKIYPYILFFITAFIPVLAYGQSSNIARELNSFYNSAIIIGGILAVLMIVVGGIYFTVSGGSADRKSEGKDYITSAIWGLVLLLGAYLILNTINPQLVSLEAPSPPQAVVLEGASCASNPNMDECAEDQDPYDQNNNLQCCVNTEGSGTASACQEEVPQEFEYCQTQNSRGALESDEDFVNVFACNNSPNFDMGIYCHDEIYWINDALDTSTAQDAVLSLEEGSRTSWKVAYPQNKGPEDAKCGMYAWKTPDDGWEEANVRGLTECTDN